jgi:hypothetical protein
MIMSDLGVGGSDAGGDVSESTTTETTTETTTTETTVDPAVAEEVAAVPGDEPPPLAAAPTEEETTEEQPAETPAIEDDQQKPEIPSLDQARWQRVHAGYRWAREIGKALGIVGEDGRVDVTLFPSVEEIKGMRIAYSDRLAMEHDFSSGIPENAQTFLDNWNKFSPQGMVAVAANLPNYLATENQQAYNAAAVPIIQRFVDHVYRSASVDPDPKHQQHILTLAKNLDWWLSGGYEGGRVPNRAAPPQPTAVEQRLAQTEAELQRRDSEAANARWKYFGDGVRTRVKSEMDKAVEEAVSPLKPAYPNTLAYNAVRDQFLRQLHQALQADTPAQRQYQIAVERARMSQTPQDQEALTTLYMTMVRRAIHSIRGPFVTEATKGIRQASEARHAALANGASKTAPTAGGAPRAQSIAPLKREPHETFGEFQLRQITRDLGG